MSSRSTKHAKTCLHIPRISQEICLRVKIWSVVLQPGRLCSPCSNFDSTLCRHLLSTHLAYTFYGRVRCDILRIFEHSLRSSFLYIGMTTPVCQYFGVFPSSHATLHTLVNQRTLFPFDAFNISDRILSSPQFFRISIFVWLLHFPTINRITCVSGCSCP